MRCRPEPCNDRARAVEQRLQLNAAQSPPVIRVVPEAPDFQLALEPKPRGPGRDVRRERTGIIGTVLPDVPDHTVAIGERCLFHAPSLGKSRNPTAIPPPRTTNYISVHAREWRRPDRRLSTGRRHGG